MLLVVLEVHLEVVIPAACWPVAPRAANQGAEVGGALNHIACLPSVVWYVLSDLRSMMGEMDPDTIITLHTIVRPFAQSKGSGVALDNLIGALQSVDHQHIDA